MSTRGILEIHWTAKWPLLSLQGSNSVRQTIVEVHEVSSIVVLLVLLSLTVVSFWGFLFAHCMWVGDGARMLGRFGRG